MEHIRLSTSKPLVTWLCEIAWHYRIAHRRQQPCQFNDSYTQFSYSMYIRDETIWVNAILLIVFEYIAIYCHIAIFDWILVKRHFIWEYGFWQ